MNCTHCGKEFDGNFCPDCGEKASAQNQENLSAKNPGEEAGTALVSSAAKEPKKKIGPIGIVLRVILGICMIWGFIHELNPDNNILGIDSMRKAYQYSQDVISQELYSPSSAKFPKFDKDFVSRSSELEYEGKTYRLYTVSAYVDTDNAFGATGRCTYTVKIGLPKENNSDAYYYEIVELN